MGWLDSIKDKKERDKIPERLRDKSAEDVVKELEAAEALKKKVTELEAAKQQSDEKVTQFSSQIDEIKGRLAAAEANRNTPPREQKTPEELANFVEEPDKAFTQRVGPVAMLAIHNAAMTARILAQQQLNNQDLANKGETMDGRLFMAWGSEIDEESKKYQPTQLGTPQAWIGIFYYLKGLRADELRNPEIRKKKYSFLEPSVQHNAPPPEKKDQDTLTDEEKRVAEKMGVSPENYLKRKKQMQFVNA